MMISHDKYELPLAVADTPKKLAALCGISPVTIFTSMRAAREKGCFSRYIAVDFDEEDDEI